MSKENPESFEWDSRGGTQIFFDGRVPQPTMKWGSKERTTSQGMGVNRMCVSMKILQGLPLMFYAYSLGQGLAWISGQIP